jgi:hypothetical protein
MFHTFTQNSSHEALPLYIYICCPPIRFSYPLMYSGSPAQAEILFHEAAISPFAFIMESCSVLLIKLVSL